MPDEVSLRPGGESDRKHPRTLKLTHSSVLPNGLIVAVYAPIGDVKTDTIGGKYMPSAAELARREKLKNES